MVPAVLCDLDGVIWLAHQPIPGSTEAVARLRAAGARVLFVTNNSSATIEAQEAALARVGIPAAGDVLTSAVAAAQLVSPGERVLVCGGPGIDEALAARRAWFLHPREASAEERFDTVMVGFHREFDYEAMRVAATAVMRGARLVATNDDATYPTPEGPIPGGGSILAGIATAAGVTPTIAGKPHGAMATLVRHTLGLSDDDDVGALVMVGDRAETDGAFAATLGCRWALVWSGVTPPGEVPDAPAAELALADLAAVAEVLLHE
jgi:4-nitrophenyl phosphatase